MSYPRRAPVSRYVCILSCGALRRSVGDLSSHTKSGQMRANPCRCSSLNASQRAWLIYDASGERLAPLGKINPVEGSKTRPARVERFHTTKSAVSAVLRSPVSLEVGGMMMRSPGLPMHTGRNVSGASNSTKVDFFPLSDYADRPVAAQ